MGGSAWLEGDGGIWCGSCWRSGLDKSVLAANHCLPTAAAATLSRPISLPTCLPFPVPPAMRSTSTSSAACLSATSSSLRSC